MRPAFLQPLGDPLIRRLLVGGAISAYGDALQGAAQAWTVVQLTHSPKGVGQFALAWLAPRAISALIAGTIVDRHQRSVILKLAVGWSAILSTVLFAFALFQSLTFSVLLLLSLGLSFAQPFEVNARNSLISSLVPREGLPGVISRTFVLMYAAELLGLVSGGLLLHSVGLVGCVALNLVTYVGYLTLVRPIVSPPVPTTGASAWQSFTEGSRFVTQRPSALVPLLVSALFAVLGFHFDRTCLALFAVEELGASARLYGVLLAMAPLGAVVCLAAMSSRSRALWRRVVVTLVFLAAGLALLALCTKPRWAALLLFVIGGARAVHYNSIATMLQLDVPDSLRGRIFAFYSLSTGLFGVGGAIMTTLAPWLGFLLGWHVLGTADLHGLRAAMLCAALAVVVGASFSVGPLRRNAVLDDRLSVEPR